MSLTTDPKTGRILSSKEKRPVRLEITKDCGAIGSDRFDPVFRKGDVWELPVGIARGPLQYHQARLTDAKATKKWSDEKKKSDAARSAARQQLVEARDKLRDELEPEVRAELAKEARLEAKNAIRRELLAAARAAGNFGRIPSADLKAAAAAVGGAELQDGAGDDAKKKKSDAK